MAKLTIIWTTHVYNFETICLFCVLHNYMKQGTKNELV
jgi:hypothetical protein